MKCMKKRCMALLLCFVMIAGLFANVPMVAKAGISMTADDALNWVKSQVGHSVGNTYQGSYQCVGLPYQYMRALGISNPFGGNASEYATTNSVPSDITRIPNATPQKGDILIYLGGYGHVAIYENDYSTYHQNYGNPPAQCVTHETWKYNNSNYLSSGQYYWGVWRPNFASGSSTPDVSYETYGEGGSRGSVSETNATLYSVIHTSARSNIWIGLRIGTSAGNWNVKIHEEGLSNAGYSQLNSNGYFETWFECNNELGVTLSQGTIYYYQFYVKINGTEYADSVRSFKTTGLSSHDPVGDANVIQSENDTVRVRGWTYDEDVPTKSIDVHIYMGGPAGTGQCVATATANQLRTDVNDSFPGVGNYHGFDLTFTTSLRGNQSVYVYAINAGGGDHNPCIGSGSVNITGDITKPVVSNMKIYNVSKEGYSVSCTVSDNVGVTKVKFPTWLPNYSEADIHWIEGTLNGNTATCYVRASDFTNESSRFTTDIRAWDAAGNMSDVVRDKVFIDQNAPQISDIQITDENEEGYTISCKVTDDYSGVSKVCFLTQLTDADAASGWQNNANTQGTKEGDRYFFKVPFEDYDYENGKYTTTIYACDGFGNEKSIKYSHDVYGEIPEEDIPAGQPVPKGLWIAGVSPQTYTGKAIKPAVRVYDNNRLLVEKRDYSISYKNNVKANDASNEKAAPTITVTGKGNYTGKDSVTFSIMQKNIADADVSAENLILKANGKVQKPIPMLTYNGKKLVNKKDFTVTFPDVGDGAYKENGIYSVRISGIGNYTGSREVTVTVTGAKMASKLTVGSIGKQLYTGEPIEPSLVVKDEKKVLKQGEDYTVSFENNKEIGTATAMVTGIGNYAGTKKVTFKIVANASIGSAQITMTTADGWNFVGGTYTGNEIRPDQYTVNVTIKGKGNQTKTVTLKEGSDYTVSYQNNVNAGTATMLFKGINGYSGSQKKTYRITAFDMRGTGQDDPGVDVVLNGTYTYTKAGCMAKPTVLFGGSTLKEGRDYSLSYKNIAKVNDGSDQKKLPTVVIKGKGNFKGSIEKTYQIAAEDLGNMTLTAKDIVWKNKAGIFKTRVVIKDQTGKTLNAGKDYETKLAYTYENDTALKEDVIRRAGEEVQAKDILPAGTIIRVTASAKKGGGYQGTVSGTYRITNADINKAVVKIPAQVYTGKAVKVDNVMQVTMNGKPLSTDNYKIVSYSNNRNKGTASVTIKGKNDCGGIRTVKFKIKSKGFLWWWRS